jgi:hypothetical protein
MCMALNAPGWCMCACIHSPGCISGDGAAAAHAAAMASGERSTCEPSQVSKKLPGMTHLETGLPYYFGIRLVTFGIELIMSLV